MSLPSFNTKIQELSLMQSAWASLLDPILDQELSKASLLKNVSLAPGSNTINHKLGRKLQGWIITRQRASGAFYDLQESNQMPDLTLVLNSSATVVVDILVF